MLNFLWLGLLATGVIIAALTGRLETVNTAVFSGAKAAVLDIALPLAGTMALWLGLMRLAERAGLIGLLAKVIRPVMRRLFPTVPPADPAMGAMMMSVAANMLGVSNAATPLGLKAMAELNRLNSGAPVASNAMCTFLALNTSAVQLVPATAMNILAINGGKAPTAIIPSTILATATATVGAILIVKTLERLPVFARRDVREGAPEAALPAVLVEAPAAGVAEAQTPDAPRRLAPWAFWGLAILAAACAWAFLQAWLPEWFGRSAPAGNPGPAPANFFRALSPTAVPFLVAAFPLYAAGRGVPVFAEFVEGAKEGFGVATRIIPFLVGMLVALAVFRESGALDLLSAGLAPLARALQTPTELLPMILMRPLSGSGAIAVLSDVVKRFGADGLLPYTAATIYGSSETTFYVVAVYFGSVNVTRTRHAIPAGLLADLVGTVAALTICRWLFGG